MYLLKIVHVAAMSRAQNKIKIYDTSQVVLNHMD